MWRARDGTVGEKAIERNGLHMIDVQDEEDLEKLEVSMCL